MATLCTISLSMPQTKRFTSAQPTKRNQITLLYTPLQLFQPNRHSNLHLLIEPGPTSPFSKPSALAASSKQHTPSHPPSSPSPTPPPSPSTLSSLPPPDANHSPRPAPSYSITTAFFLASCAIYSFHILLMQGIPYVRTYMLCFILISVALGYILIRCAGSLWGYTLGVAGVVLVVV